LCPPISAHNSTNRKEKILTQYYTRRLNSENFPSPDKWDLCNKIAVFEDYVFGWQLEPAEDVAKGISDSGFAVLRIILAYFEMIAKYDPAFANLTKSSELYEQGVKSVVDLARISGSDAKVFIDKLYKDGRCALYHSAMAGFGFALTGDLKAPFTLDADSKTLIINPFNLVELIRGHFNEFCKKLKDPNEKDLRDHFEKRFDKEIKA
jgi:DNA-binding ferritin-like protein (Dps family)